MDAHNHRRIGRVVIAKGRDAATWRYHPPLGLEIGAV